MAVLTALSTTIPHRRSRWRNELPPAVDELVMRLLVKDPADRPESAEVVVKRSGASSARRRAAKSRTFDVHAAAGRRRGPDRQSLAQAAPESEPRQSATKRRRRQRAIAIAAAMVRSGRRRGGRGSRCCASANARLDAGAAEPTSIAAVTSAPARPNALQNDRAVSRHNRWLADSSRTAGRSVRRHRGEFACGS